MGYVQMLRSCLWPICCRPTFTHLIPVLPAGYCLPQNILSQLCSSTSLKGQCIYCTIQNIMLLFRLWSGMPVSEWPTKRFYCTQTSYADTAHCNFSCMHFFEEDFGRQKGENVKVVDEEVGMRWRGGSTDGEGCSNDRGRRKNSER